VTSPVVFSHGAINARVFRMLADAGT